MPADDERLAELRANVGKAIQEFLSYQQKLFWDRDDIYVLSWIVASESTSPEMEQREQALPGVITPDGQMASTSIGLLQSGIWSWQP